MKKKGFTLVEVVVSLVVIAIIMYAVIAIFITSGAKGVNVDIFTVAQSLAEEGMEQEMARDFDQITNSNVINFTGDLSSYQKQVIVFNVDGANLDVQVAPNSTPYKKIQVRITHPLLTNGVILESIRAEY